MRQSEWDAARAKRKARAAKTVKANAKAADEAKRKALGRGVQAPFPGASGKREARADRTRAERAKKSSKVEAPAEADDTEQEV
jgi:hypothetical protein